MKDINGDYPLFVACRQEYTNAAVLQKLLQAYPEAAFKRSKGHLVM